MLGVVFHTLTTPYAQLLTINALGYRGNAFRVVAPGARQGAAFKEYRRSQTRTIMDRISHDIED